jgi:hypothetical protein
VASRVITLITDDLDGTEAQETVTFALDGTEFEVDLNDAHAKELRVALEPYMKAGRKTGSKGRRRRSSASTDGDQIKAMRSWAKAHNLKVSDRGRVSAEIREAYSKAH